MSANTKFYWLLHEQRDASGKPWTVAKLAEAIGSGRSHVNQVLNNKPQRGGHTRRKLVRVFKDRFGRWQEILRSLDWDESGNGPATAEAGVSRETFHVERE